VTNTEGKLGETGYSPPRHAQDPANPGSRGVGVFGLGVILTGFVLVAFAYLFPTWVDYGHASTAYSASALRHAPHVTGFVDGYFTWLGWLMLIVTTSFAVGGALPIVMRVTSARIGAFFGVLSAAMTLAVLSDLANPQTLTSFWHNVSSGSYFALGGFLLIALGGVIAN
jgi:hypothetical protein